MTKMISLSYQNKKYVNGDYIIEYAPIYSKGARGSRNLIKKKNISNDKYIFARKTDNKWTITDGKSAKVDKVFYIQSLLKTIPELNKETKEKITDDNGIEKAPHLIYLLDEEKFKDNDGNVVEIETRGERTLSGVYFNVKDIMKGFNLDNLYNTIIDNRRDGYIEGKHYKYFICNIFGGAINKPSKNTNNKSIVKKELFLTYFGILRVLFSSTSKTTEKFVYWATNTLFTIQMGTTEQKKELVANILGVSAKVIKEVFNTGVNTIPCIYLFTLNTVKNLRQSMNIDDKYSDDSIVCKYGFTKDLSRRTTEQIDTYKKINNCELKLKYYSYIDPQYISKGESDIRMFMNALNINFSYENMEELVIIPKQYINLVQKQYEQIGHNYMGHISELVTKIKDLEDKYEKLQLNHTIDLQKERHERELQKEKYENELLKKEVELMKLQLKYK
jgi:hypothetical protein